MGVSGCGVLGGLESSNYLAIITVEDKQDSRLDLFSDSVTACLSLKEVVIGPEVGVPQSNSQSESIIVSNSEAGLVEVVEVVEGGFREKASEPLSLEVSASKSQVRKLLGLPGTGGICPTTRAEAERRVGGIRGI